MVVQIPVFLGYPLLDYALFITPPRCHLLGPQGIAPDEVAEPVVLDVAHLSRKRSSWSTPAVRSRSICGFVMAGI